MSLPTGAALHMLQRLAEVTGLPVGPAGRPRAGGALLLRLHGAPAAARNVTHAEQVVAGTADSQEAALDVEEESIATPLELAWIFVAMFVPIALCWVALHCCGLPRGPYAVLLPVTLMMAIIGFDIGNQSLSAEMGFPMAITALHATCLGTVMGAYSLSFERKELFSVDPWPILQWTLMVAPLFAIYQLTNHLMSYYCSLSERVVFQNLCPVISLTLESLVMPANRTPEVNLRSKLALVGMAVGAIFFSSQKHDFSAVGLLSASILVVSIVLYRLTQRWMISSVCRDCPIGIIASLDGWALLIPSVIVSATQVEHPADRMNDWFTTGSIIFMAILTSGVFILTHVCGLLMMRISTATSYIVFSNIANFIIVFQSWLFFDDNFMESAIMVIGLGGSLFFGFWYSVEVQWKGLSRAAAEEAKAAMLPLPLPPKSPVEALPDGAGNGAGPASHLLTAGGS